MTDALNMMSIVCISQCTQSRMLACKVKFYGGGVEEMMDFDVLKSKFQIIIIKTYYIHVLWYLYN